MNEEAVNQSKDIKNPDHERRWEHIGIFDMFDDGENLWFTSLEYNALFKMSKRTFDVDYVGSFPDEEAYGGRLYTSVNECNGKLYFTPCTAHEIGIYDMKNECFEKGSIGISRDDNDLLKIKYAKKFVSGFIYNNSLILIPCCYDCIIIYDIVTGEVTFKTDLFEYFYEKYRHYTTSPDAQFYLCWFAKRLSESEIVFHLHCNRNILIIYNLETGGFKEQAIGSKKSTFSLVECDGSQVYLYEASTDTLVKWEMESGKYLECHIAAQVSELQPCGLEYSFLNMAVLGEWLYLIPANANVAVKVDTITLEAFSVDALSGECSIPYKGTVYLNLSRVSDNKLYLFGNRSKDLVVYGKDEDLQRIRLKPPKDIENIIAEQFLADLIRRSRCWFSEEHVPLTRFINALVSLKTYERCAGNRNIAVGNGDCRIYHLVKQKLLD